MYLIVLMYVLLASTFTISKTVFHYLSPIAFIGVRMTLGGAILLSFLYFFRRDQLRINKQHLGIFFQVALFHIYVTYVFEYWGLVSLTTFKTAFIISLSPFFSVIFAYIFLSETMNPRKWAALLVGFVGFCLMLANGRSPGEVGKNALLFFSWPELSLLTAVCSMVYGWVLVKKIIKTGGYSPMLVNGFGMVAGGLLAFPTSLLFEKSFLARSMDLWTISDLFACFGYTMLLILITNVAAYNMYGHLLKKYSVTFLAFAGFICTLAAAFFGNIFLGEVPDLNFFLAVAAVTVGLYLFYREEVTAGH